MKKFSRCALILILVMAVAAIGGYMYLNSTSQYMYSSSTKLYVVIGEEMDASLRASDGGLNEDFTELIMGEAVIAEAQKTAGNSENIAAYLTVNTPANSNIIEIVCTNPDMATAKLYVDEVAKATVKLAQKTIPIQSIRILSEGTHDNIPFVADLYKNTAIIAVLAGTLCLAVELIVVLIIVAFKPKKDDSDDELDYERRYGMYSAFQLASNMKAVESDTARISTVNDVLDDAAISMEIYEEDNVSTQNEPIANADKSEEKYAGSKKDNSEKKEHKKDKKVKTKESEDKLSVDNSTIDDIIQRELAQMSEDNEEDDVETEYGTIIHYDEEENEEQASSYDMKEIKYDSADDSSANDEADALDDMSEEDVLGEYDDLKSSSEVLGIIKK